MTEYTLKGITLVDINEKGGQDVSGWRTETPVVEKEHCIGCGLCVSYCPEAAITLIEKQPKIDLRFCKGCGICAYECRSNAIHMINSDI